MTSARLGKCSLYRNLMLLLPRHTNTKMLQSKADKTIVYSILCLATALFSVPCQGCSNGGIMNASTGVLSSDGFPSNYPPNAHCLWQITAPLGHVIKLTFNSFRLQRCASCTCDAVEMSSSADFNPGRTECETSVPDPVYSDGHKFYVKFRSDPKIQEKGFKATYTTVPKNRACDGNGILNSSNGILQSDGYPNSYPYNTKCEWRIVAAQGNRIKLTFEDFQLEYSPNCEYDFVAIRDGPDYNSPKLAQLCSNSKPASVLSTGRYMYVKFSSDLASNHKGFRATYKTLPNTGESCPHTVKLDEKSGTFSSPNYPNSYTKNLNCSWKIPVPSGYEVKINFTSFNMQSCGESCACDFVEVFSVSSGWRKRFCGASSPGSVISRSTVTFIRFKSDNTVNGPGFKASYTVVKRPTTEPSTSNPVLPGSCMTELTGTNGTFQTQKYDPSINTNLVNCTWLIIVPRGYHVKLEFQELALDQCVSCHCAFVEVRDGKFNTSFLMGRFCGVKTPPPLFSKNRHLLVRYVTISRKPRDSFKARYQAVRMTAGVATTDESSPSALTPPVIIGLVIGVLLFLGIVALLAVYIKRKRKTKTKTTGASVASVSYNPRLIPEESPKQPARGHVFVGATPTSQAAATKKEATSPGTRSVHQHENTNLLGSATAVVS